RHTRFSRDWSSDVCSSDLTERGLLVPVIKNAGDLSLAEIAKSIADLASRTRENKVKPDELSGATFTITNTGSGGALIDTPIVNRSEERRVGKESKAERRTQ